MTTRAVGAILLAGAILAGCGASFNDAKAPTAPRPTFQANVLEGSVSAPHLTQMYVGYAVSNVGAVRGIATCAVLVDGQVRARFDTHVLAAGASWYQVRVVSIPLWLGERIERAEVRIWDAVKTTCTNSGLGEH